MRYVLGPLLLLPLAACGSEDEGRAGTSVADSLGSPFDPNGVPEVELLMDPADWDALVAEPHADVWRRATLRWGGATWPDVGVQPSGQNSRIRGNPKPSLLLNFEQFVPGRRFHGLPSLKLNWLLDDPAMMRQWLVFAIHRARGRPAPREGYARLFVNGSYKGLYGVTERINREFVRARFGPGVNQLYKKTATGEDFVWHGPDPSLYVPRMFEPSIEALPAGAEEVRDLFDALHHRPYEEVARVLDVEAFLEFIAIEVLTCEDDGYRSGPDARGNLWSSNFYLYKSPRSGRFLLLPWDRGESYWRPIDEPITFTFERRVLTRRLLVERPENLPRFRRILAELIAGPSAPDVMAARVEHLRHRLEAYVPLEPPNPHRLWSGPQQWTWEVDGLKRDFILGRIEQIRRQLASP